MDGNRWLHLQFLTICIFGLFRIRGVTSLLLQDHGYMKIQGKHGHYFTKRNEKAEKNEENEGLRIAESTWEQSAHCREVSRSSTITPNDPEHDDAEEWCKTAMNYTKGRIAELIGDSD
uniref:Uncharacterized protein n=1 Tax=Solanum tuberosum TaxID=4113 RepID=M1DGR2_SOLTU